MATNSIIVDGSVGGTNTVVVKVITQTTETADTTVNAAANKGYILTHTSLQTVNLPSSPTVGDVFALHGNGSGLFKVAQAAGEQITLGEKLTTLGVTGFIDSTNAGDEIYLICTDVAGKWKNDGGYGGNFLIDGVTLTNTINNASSGVASIIDGTGISSSSDMDNNVTITNTAPDQTVVLNSGTGISVTGTYPTFTVINTAPASSTSYGQFYKNYTSNAESLTINVWQLWNSGTFNSVELTDFTRSTSRLTYTGTPTKKFDVSFSVSTAAGSSAANFEIAVYKNGTRVEATRIGFRNNGGNPFPCSTDSLISMETDDYIEGFVMQTSGSITMNAERVSLVATQAS